MTTQELKEELKDLTEAVAEERTNYEDCKKDLMNAIEYRDKALMYVVKAECALDRFKEENRVDLFTQLGTI